MNWRIVQHKDLLMTDGLRIAQLKNQHWQYGIESQLIWMGKYIQSDDMHLLGETDSATKLMAYTTLSKVVVAIDDVSVKCLGVGGVCVDVAHQHQGLGKQLMQQVSDYIHNREKQGILLCKNELIPFYEKNDWRVMTCYNAMIAGNTYEHNIMFLDRKVVCSKIMIDRSF